MHPLIEEKLNKVRADLQLGPLNDPWDLYDLSFYLQGSSAQQDVDASDFEGSLDPRVVALVPGQTERLELLRAFVGFLKTPEINPEIVAIFAAISKAREPEGLVPLVDFVLQHWNTLPSETKIQLLYRMSDLANTLPPGSLPSDRVAALARILERDQKTEDPKLIFELKKFHAELAPH